MTSDRPAEYLAGLVRELCKLPKETEWVELKVNDAKPQEIGEYISALSNSAALAGKAFAYLVWGVADGDHPSSARDSRLARPKSATKSWRTGSCAC